VLWKLNKKAISNAFDTIEFIAT